MTRVSFLLVMVIGLALAGAACERHSAVELEAEHGDPAPTEHVTTNTPQENMAEVAEVKKEAQGEGSPGRTAGATATEEKKPEAPKFFPDSN